MSTATDVNRALAYTYLLRAAILPLSVVGLIILLSLIGLFYLANAVSLWWLLFLVPLGGLLLITIAVISLGFVALNALKPRTLSRSERSQLKSFIDYANSQLAEAGTLRGGPFGVIYGVLKRKYKHKLNLSQAVLKPLQDAPELRKRYQQLVKTFGRVDA